MTTERKRENVGITGWDDPRSYIKRTDMAGQIAYKGTFVLNGAEFRFSLNQQSIGKYIMRGRVSAISPEDGFVLQVIGTEKKRRLDRKMTALSENERNSDASEKSKREKVLNITAELYGQSLAEEIIKTDVERAVLRLYARYADLIHRRLKTSSRPDTIIPSVAAVLYVWDYLAVNHRNISDDTRKTYAKAIKDYYAKMPAIPMAKITKVKMKQYLDSHSVSTNTLRLLHGFWEYCLAKGICVGSNPFPEPRKRKLSPTIKQAKAVAPDELSGKMQDKLYEYLFKGAVSGEACGIALMLWGGFSAKDACAFIWEDIIFDQERSDFVRVRYHQNDKAGATHDFTRVLFIQGARILYRRYNELIALHGLDKIVKCPVVSAKSNYKKAMTAEALTQFAGMLLRTIGITEEIFAKLKTPKVAVSSRILRNTYIKNLILRCGLSIDPGTVNFMLGQSLSGSVTDDHYSSFASELATERIFTALKAAGPLEDIMQPETPESLKDGREQYTIAPENTRQRVGVVTDIILQPGEELEIICLHGVSGSIRTRAVTEKGLRRKSVKLKD